MYMRAHTLLFYLNFTIPLGGACAHPSRTIEHISREWFTPSIVDCASHFVRSRTQSSVLQHLYFHLLWRCHWPAHHTTPQTTKIVNIKHSNIQLWSCVMWNFPMFSISYFLHPQNILDLCVRCLVNTVHWILKLKPCHFFFYSGLLSLQ